MDHNDAIRLEAGSRYLAGGLPEEEARAFEEHFFSCEECAEELKADAIFAANVRAVFQDESSRNRSLHKLSMAGWLGTLLSDRFGAAWALPLAAAACALLAVVIYQNVFMIPGYKTELADLRQPQSVAMVPLKLARGAIAQPVPQTRYWVPYFYLPDASETQTYQCDIETSGGVLLKTVALAKPAPGQPFSVFLSRSDFSSGAYVFKVHGPNSKTTIATYTIDLRTE